MIEYKTSYDKANCLVMFDNSKIGVDSIVTAINETGYKVKSQKVISN